MDSLSDIEHWNNDYSSTSFRGSVFYKTSSSSNGKLSFLNIKIEVFETEVNKSGNSIEKRWEWK